MDPRNGPRREWTTEDRSIQREEELRLKKKNMERKRRLTIANRIAQLHQLALSLLDCDTCKHHRTGSVDILDTCCRVFKSVASIITQQPELKTELHGALGKHTACSGTRTTGLQAIRRVQNLKSEIGENQHAGQTHQLNLSINAALTLARSVLHQSAKYTNSLVTHPLANEHCGASHYITTLSSDMRYSFSLPKSFPQLSPLASCLSNQSASTPMVSVPCALNGVTSDRSELDSGISMDVQICTSPPSRILAAGGEIVTEIWRPYLA